MHLFGKYFSIEYIRREILRQTEEQIKEIDEQVESEMADGKIMDPNAMIDPATGMPMDPAAAGGAPPMQASADSGDVGEQPNKIEPTDLKKGEF